MYDRSFAYFENTVFDSNLATTEGGVFWANNSLTTLNNTASLAVNCTFSNNAVVAATLTGGGGVYWLGINTDFAAQGCTFSNSSAYWTGGGQGGLARLSTSTATLTFTNCSSDVSYVHPVDGFGIQHSLAISALGLCYIHIPLRWSGVRKRRKIPFY